MAALNIQLTWHPPLTHRCLPSSHPTHYPITAQVCLYISSNSVHSSLCPQPPHMQHLHTPAYLQLQSSHACLNNVSSGSVLSKCHASWVILSYAMHVLSYAYFSIVYMIWLKCPCPMLIRHPVIYWPVLNVLSCRSGLLSLIYIWYTWHCVILFEP